MAYTLGQASKATGVSKPTLSRAIKRGTISARRNPDGTFAIEPAELHRVYPPVSADSSTATGPLVFHEPAHETALERENQLLREVIADLRARLDAEAEERRALSLRLLEDRRPWWRRWRR
jgi:hypothetical protein